MPVEISTALSMEWGAMKIPAEAICGEVRLGDLNLCGYWVPQGCRKLSARQTIWADTYWTVDKKIEHDCQIQLVAVPERKCRMKEFGQTFSRDDDPARCTSNWVSGAVYKIHFALEMPPLEEIANADLTLELRVIVDGKVQGVRRDTQKIEMNFSHTPQYRLEFPPSLYQNHFGRYWTARQIEEITGGKWIVSPPENFFVRSFCRRSASIKVM